SISIRVGGLPQKPRPPLGYQMVFAIEGLTNEYTGHALVLRGGKIVEVPTLEEDETIDFPEPVGRCEAFTTSGGTSTCPRTFAGTPDACGSRTVRDPGPAEHIRVVRGLGLFDPDPVAGVQPVGGRLPVSVAPRAVLHKVMAPRLTFPEAKDLVVVRVTCRG